jgi:hypothetical protein
MRKFLVTCTKIYNGTMFVDAENNEEALEIAQNKLNENVDCINWDFGEATADIADLDEDESHLDPDYEPKYHVGEYIVWHHYDYKTCTMKDDIFQITDIKDGKYICSDGKKDSCDFLDYDKDFRIATDDEVRAYNKYNVGDFIVSECGTIYKVISAELGSYIAENKYGDERCHFDNDNGVFNFRLATPYEVNIYKNQTYPRYKVGDIVKSDNSPADKIVSVNSENYFFENGKQMDIILLDDDANFYLVQPPKYNVGDYVGDYHYGYYQITAIKDDKYVFDDGDEVPIAIFDADENHHIETFHREDFQPFDKVLVRDDKRCVWVCAFFSHIDYSSKVKPYVTCVGEVWEQCVPFNEDTRHLLGTTTEYNGKYKTW